MRRGVMVLAIVMVSAVLIGAGFEARVGGEARSFTAELSGDNEVPPVVTNTTGKVNFHVNRAQTALKFKMKVFRSSDLLGAAGAHIHCAPEGENGPVVAFLAGSIPGGFDGKVEVSATLKRANIDPAAGCGSNIAELVEAIRAGNTYVNVHSSGVPSGVVRGQIVPNA